MEVGWIPAGARRSLGGMCQAWGKQGRAVRQVESPACPGAQHPQRHASKAARRLDHRWLLGLILTLLLAVPLWAWAQPANQTAAQGDRIAEAQALLAEDPAAALVLADQELARVEQAGDLLAQSRVEELRAQIFVALRRFGDAGVAYDDAITLAEEARAPARALAILSNLSKLHFRIGEYYGAMDAEQRSLDIARRANLLLQEAQSLNNIGVLHRRQGDPEQALDFYQQSLAIREQIDDRRGVAQSLNNIGILHKNWGNHFQALEYHLRALNIRRGLNRAVETAESLSNIGIIYRNLDDFDKALEYFEESLRVLGEQMPQRERVTSELNIGHTLLLQQRHDAAEEHLHRALDIARELSLRPQIAEILELMGELALARDDAGTAQARYAQALRLAEEIGEPSQVASILIHQATAYLAEGQIDQAQPLLDQADQLAEGLAEPTISRDLALVRSRLLAAQSRFPEALAERDRYEELALQLVDAGNSRRMADLEASLALQRSEADLNAALLQNSLQEEMVERQRIIGAGLIFAVIATLAVIALLVGRFRLVRKVNAALSEQSAHSRRQHDELSLAHSELERRAEELSIAGPPTKSLFEEEVLEKEEKIVPRHSGEYDYNPLHPPGFSSPYKKTPWGLIIGIGVAAVAVLGIVILIISNS